MPLRDAGSFIATMPTQSAASSGAAVATLPVASPFVLHRAPRERVLRLLLVAVPPLLLIRYFSIQRYFSHLR